jgi:hypothetical protein
VNRMWAFVFFASGLAVLIYGIGLVRDARACAHWPKVEGRVTSAEAQVVAKEKNKTTYAPNVAYTYVVDGKRYESSRLTLVPRNYVGLQQVQAVLAAYPVHGTVSVFYDPRDPANCVLVSVATGTEWAYPIGGLLLMGAGFLFLKRG